MHQKEKLNIFDLDSLLHNNFTTYFQDILGTPDFQKLKEFFLYDTDKIFQ